jgi:hypothetical protein
MCKEELLTDVKNLLYHRTDDVKRLQKVISDTEQQFVDGLQQVKTLGEKDERRQKELEDLRGAAQELVDMVDPPEEGVVNPRPLLERLRGAPKKVLKVFSEALVACVSNTLGLHARRAPRDICSGNGGGLHRGMIRRVPPRSQTCSRTNSTKCPARLGCEETSTHSPVYILYLMSLLVCVCLG